MGIGFFVNSALLGVGLAMDAFSVSLANGLNEPCMKMRKLFGIAGVFALFQALMPMLGWLCVHTVVEHFRAFAGFVPYLALVLLCYIGGNMIFDGMKGERVCGAGVGFAALLVQGMATSIDALSVGFTIAEYGAAEALLSALIIAAVTFVICTAGLLIGRKAGTKLAGKAGILGGCILIFIGIEIVVTHLI